MGPREIYEGSWYFLCVILSSDIVSYKIYKKNGYSKCFYNFMGFWGYTGPPMVKMCSSDTVPIPTQHQAVSSDIVPKPTQSMGDMDLPSNPF